MAEVVGVKFKEVGKVYYFSPDSKKFNKGDMVIVETSRGVECGEIAMENKEVPESEIMRPLKSIIRLAGEEDIKITKAKRQSEDPIAVFCLFNRYFHVARVALDLASAARRGIRHVTITRGCLYDKDLIAEKTSLNVTRRHSNR